MLCPGCHCELISELDICPCCGMVLQDNRSHQVERLDLVGKPGNNGDASIHRGNKSDENGRKTYINSREAANTSYSSTQNKKYYSNIKSEDTIGLGQKIIIAELFALIIIEILKLIISFK